MSENKKLEPFFLEGFAVEGTQIEAQKDKRFTILAREYRELPSLDDSEKVERKLVLGIEIVETKQRLDYFPNKTSQKSMGRKFGPNVNDWIGKQAEWEVTHQMVAGNKKAVLFVKE